jgi:hypothetical protein
MSLGTKTGTCARRFATAFRPVGALRRRRRREDQMCGLVWVISKERTTLDPTTTVRKH